MNRCFWFRHDLRLKDNTALLEASQYKGGSLSALYIIAHHTWQRHCWSDAKVDLILRQLKILSIALNTLNIPLKIISVKSFALIPDTLSKFCIEHNISSVFVNKELLVDEIRRDHLVKQKLNAHHIEFFEYDDVTILPPNETLKHDGTPFKVFTPFKRNWLKVVTPDRYFTDHKKPKKQAPCSIKPDQIPDKITGFKRTPHQVDTWPESEIKAHKRLGVFCENKVMRYEQDRDMPAIDGTSQISAYLANGLLSTRQCITTLCDSFNAQTLGRITSKGGSCWLSELIWREFYYALAFLFPEVVKSEPFKPETKQLRWSQNQKNFQSWCDGNTGFPLVDSGMRQLKQTGWMHNRLRMVTAMFLTKTLYINWRWGEDYFMRHLIDGDFASNNGGWQWSASTGCDAVPYFRIFNPTTQSERFDSKGSFIRQYCPELANCTDKQIHNPPLELRRECNYPVPIVDYSAMRAKVLAAFKELKK